jgi:hypothetical protein
MSRSPSRKLIRALESTLSSPLAFAALTRRSRKDILELRGRSGFDGSSRVRKARRGSTPPVIGVEQHNCQYAVCIRCLNKASASPPPAPAGRKEASSSGLAWNLLPEGFG